MAEKSGKILYAEDDEVLRMVCSRHIEMLFPDYEVECFEDGISLEKRLNDGIGNVRAIVTDNNMPGITGNEIIRKYAQREELRNLPFILFYAGDESLGRDLVKNYGAFAYAMKGSAPKLLMDKIREALDYYKFKVLSQ